ncbi:methionine adenosyltransferase 2 subunit beta-like protein [Chrysochromulina tobinii]|uniref:Methionine adenosyltransferase 2 subunit beta-like protein n=1 Tax=Chrysochromulina tobinii TaxID=1460289 RepID=A0A0M0JH53_9EUKA|nr:methionine adenosyltransferase 2 subunit beta-like protein [Chrysochromulina tobinii]|eukprot:KOO25909.1 methionine adenosyltransferase 2 subunit beta-like protein [Chrysochromulina sp. CCMP291]
MSENAKFRVAAACAATVAVTILIFRSRRHVSKRMLVTGASGYLGQHLVAALHSAEPGLEVHVAFGGLETYESDVAGTVASVTKVDLADAVAIRSLVRSVRPDIVVHLAAVSSPVVCEKNAARSDAINTPHALLNALPTSTTFIFLSTDQVYDGIAGRYANAAPAQPVNRYGRSKLAFELALHAALPASMSLRSSLILGPRTPGRCRKQSFLQFCEDRARGALQTDFIADEYRSVVWVGDLVQIIRWAALQGGASSHAGVYNMGGPERLTRVDVAREVVKALTPAPSLAVANGLPPYFRGVSKASLGDMGVASPPDISMDSSRVAALSGVALTPLDVAVAMALPRCNLPSADLVPMTLIIQLGACNDEAGVVDADVRARCRRTRELLEAHPNARVLTSGGADPRFKFNPTSTPHWQLVERALLEAGVSEAALLRPGMPALHTVHEAMMSHERVRQWLVGRRPTEVFREIIVLTSDYHLARVAHLFGVVFGSHARLDVPVRFEAVAVAIQSEEWIAARRVHEAKALATLKSAPYEPWLGWLKARGLEGVNSRGV